MPLKAFLLFSAAFIGIKTAEDIPIKSIYVNFTLRKYVIIVQLSRNESGVSDKQENNPPGEGNMLVPLVKKIICKTTGLRQINE